MDAIRHFTGDREDVAVVPEAVQAMMVDYDTKVSHYEIVDTSRPAPFDSSLVKTNDREQ
jgi:hypothetical protein